MNAVESNIVSYTQVGSNARTAAQSGDRIAWIKLSLTILPLATPVSDAKVLTGRQKPMTEIAFVFAQIRTRDGHEGIGFGYSKRAGGPGLYAHARELANKQGTVQLSSGSISLQSESHPIDFRRVEIMGLDE